VRDYRRVLERRDIQAAWFSNSGWGHHSFQHSVRGQVALSANGIEGLQIVNVKIEDAGAYTVLVRNAHGSSSSLPAVISVVIAPPSITTIEKKLSF
jgi:hypothetical protein